MTRLVVEADGGSRGNPGPAGYGAVVKDAATGQVLAEAAESIGLATNNVAEYQGLIAGLTAAAAIAPDADVEVRMDSKLVVEQMSGRWQIKHPDMKPLAQQAQRLAHGFASIGYGWIPRAQNAHADRLANEAMDAAARAERPAPESDRHDQDDRPDAPDDERRTVQAFRGPAWSVASAEPMTTVLLRHGQTPLSIDKRFAGVGDTPLTETGVLQAKASARALAHSGLEAIVSSPLRRCRRTAAEVAAVTGLEVSLEPAFREVDFGEWEGLSFAEARAGWPQVMDGWLADPEVAPPGGESFAAAYRRVRTGLDVLKAGYRRRKVLVVSHVTPIKLLVRVCLEAPPLALYRMHLDTASISVIDWYEDGPAVLKLLNDTHHLDA